MRPMRGRDADSPTHGGNLSVRAGRVLRAVSPDRIREGLACYSVRKRLYWHMSVDLIVGLRV
jgi:hypothetical protein